jgi:hypothetical protein
MIVHVHLLDFVCSVMFNCCTMLYLAIFHIACCSSRDITVKSTHSP